MPVQATSIVSCCFPAAAAGNPTEALKSKSETTYRKKHKVIRSMKPISHEAGKTAELITRCRGGLWAIWDSPGIWWSGTVPRRHVSGKGQVSLVEGQSSFTPRFLVASSAIPDRCSLCHQNSWADKLLRGRFFSIKRLLDDSSAYTTCRLVWERLAINSPVTSLPTMRNHQS